MDVEDRQKRVIARWDSFLQAHGDRPLENLESEWGRFDAIASSGRPWTVGELEEAEASLSRFIKMSDWRNALSKPLGEMSVHAQTQLKALVRDGANPFELVSLLGLMSWHQKRIQSARKGAKRGHNLQPADVRELGRELRNLANRLRRLRNFAGQTGTPGFDTTLPEAMEKEARALKLLAPLVGAGRALEPIHLLADHIRETTGREHHAAMADLLAERGFTLDRHALRGRLNRRRREQAQRSGEVGRLIAERTLRIESDGWVFDEHLHLRRQR